MWNGFVTMALPKQEGKKNLLQLVCGNGIAEIEGKKIVGMNLWQCHCRNRREKNCWNEFVAMALPKQEEKKKKLFDFWQWHCRNRKLEERERENCLNKKNIVYLFLFFSSFF